jgi:tRNA(Arg) A34 adenosine deaminase TadA
MSAGPPTPRDLELMARALELARHAATLGEIPVGAVVYETATGAVLAEAHNRRHLDKDPAAHAEVLAIREAATKIGDWRLSACTLVVTLEPCCMCAGLIVNARIGRLVYACDDPKAGAVCSLHQLTTDARLNHRVTPIRGVCSEEASQLLRDFFRARRN